MRQRTLKTWAVTTVVLMINCSAFAQIRSRDMSGGANNSPTRPRLRLKKNTAPVLSPALNLLPQTATTFEGQFLMRQLPQEKLNNSTIQSGRRIEQLQKQLTQEESQIQSGLSKTGHTSRFMNCGSFFANGTGAGQRP
jgi:hypothetical protein